MSKEIVFKVGDVYDIITNQAGRDFWETFEIVEVLQNLLCWRWYGEQYKAQNAALIWMTKEHLNILLSESKANKKK